MTRFRWSVTHRSSVKFGGIPNADQAARRAFRFVVLLLWSRTCEDQGSEKEEKQKKENTASSTDIWVSAPSCHPNAYLQSSNLHLYPLIDLICLQTNLLYLYLRTSSALLLQQLYTSSIKRSSLISQACWLSRVRTPEAAFHFWWIKIKKRSVMLTSVVW